MGSKVDHIMVYLEIKKIFPSVLASSGTVELISENQKNLKLCLPLPLDVLFGLDYITKITC